MKLLLGAAFALLLACGPLVAATPEIDYSRVEVYVTPYYNSEGPVVRVGRFSAGLAGANEKEFLATIAEMKKDWAKLSFPELYVAAIRLYEHGYRAESVAWFYTAQYRGRLFSALLETTGGGELGGAGFELKQANGAFFQLLGPYINGYAFADLDGLATILERVRKEEEKTSDLEASYRGVRFKPKREWQPANTQVANGMNGLISMLRDENERGRIKRQRSESGVEAKIAKLTNKTLPAQ